MRPKILLLSAYRSDSHAAWVDWLTTNLIADWRVLELPGRYFRWRIRGNPLSWLDAVPAQLDGWCPDRILATSMVDLSTLRGLLPELANVPTSLYFHENQFAYPVSAGQHQSIDPQMVQIYAALAADELLFNSGFNRDSFLAGIDALMNKLPDAKPRQLSERLRPKCRLLPVPVEPITAPHQEYSSERLLLLWNHRWEYDKHPQALVQLADTLRKRRVPLDLALLGAGSDRHHTVKQQLLSMAEECEDVRIAVSGFLPKAEYRNWLLRADVAFGSARHEFQGLALLEAASAGAHPVVPNDLCYPEQYPAECLYPAGDTEAAANRIQLIWENKRTAARRFDANQISDWLAPTTAEQWRQWLMSFHGK